MKFKGRSIAAGDILWVLKGWRWVKWTVDSFSPGTGEIWGRTEDGPLQELHDRHGFNALLSGPDGDPIFPSCGRAPRIARSPKLADLCRQGYPPN